LKDATAKRAGPKDSFNLLFIIFDLGMGLKIRSLRYPIRLRSGLKGRDDAEIAGYQKTPTIKKGLERNAHSPLIE
jgi:hypothetical protein